MVNMNEQIFCVLLMYVDVLCQFVPHMHYCLIQTCAILYDSKNASLGEILSQCVIRFEACSNISLA